MRKIVFVIIIFSLIGGFAYKIYSPKDPLSQEETVFFIEKGEGVEEIALSLEKEGIITRKEYFIFYNLLSRKSKNLQAGSYVLSPAMNIPEITKKFIEGDVANEKLVIIEGWNLKDIAYYLESKGVFQSEELFEQTGYPLVDYSEEPEMDIPEDFSLEFDFLKDKPKNVSLEGYLFPDTYYVDQGLEIREIVVRMLNNFGKKLNSELKEEILNQEKSIFVIVTMASLIEKEVKTLEDKKIVSGILWKRIEIGIPLQVDATVIYITGKKTTRVSKEETYINSPYKYKGLPLGPIANPGLESILAAIYPESSDYLYYLSTPEGETIFSKTLKEHNIAKEKYLK